MFLFICLRGFFGYYTVSLPDSLATTTSKLITVVVLGSMKDGHTPDREAIRE
jgi:hypothetical protein